MEMDIALHKFNHKGIKQAISFINNKEDPSQAYDLAKDPELIEKVMPNKQININLEFKDKYELGKYLNEKLGKVDEDLMEDIGFWTWICFLYLDKFIERKKGKPIYRAQPNYIYNPSRRRSYRHRVAIWYKLYRLLGENSRLFLSTQEPFAQGDSIEQLASRMFILRKHMELIFDLYFDEKTGRVIDGALNQPPEKGDKPKSDGTYAGQGMIRRACDSLQQLDTVYLTHKLSLNKKKELLGEEFEFLYK